MAIPPRPLPPQHRWLTETTPRETKMYARCSRSTATADILKPDSDLPTPMPQTNNALSDGDDDVERADDGLSEKLDALAEERDTLRREVAELRQSLEDMTSQRDREVKDLRAEMDTANEERERAEQKHATLLERVNNISATLGERLKSNAVCCLVTHGSAG
jgi:peptidoglycan hydrolase CwlO-like protein